MVIFGDKNVFPILIKGLQRLEYRGYDSAGIAIYDHSLNVYKRQGKVSELETFVADKNIEGHSGIGHTRWATHGEPNDTNAHPHQSMHGNFVFGPQWYYRKLCTPKKKTLPTKAILSQSETDTEVLANLIEYFYLMDEVTRC